MSDPFDKIEEISWRLRPSTLAAVCADLEYEDMTSFAIFKQRLVEHCGEVEAMALIIREDDGRHIPLNDDDE